MARDKSETPAPESDRADDCPHPRDVYDLLGHTAAEQQVAGLISANTLHHAWLISGPTGVGKATLAYRMIRTVLGGIPATPGKLDVPQSDATAQRIQSLGHGDFLLVRRPYDEKTKKIKSAITVNETRKISGFFSRMAAEGGWRVCLIDTADDMNRNATNAVLKTLEEPPEKALIILLSSAPGRLLPTIRSRCMHLPLRAVEEGVLSQWLGNQSNADQEHISAAIKLAKGAPGKALALTRNSDTVLRSLANLLGSFPRGNGRTLHAISDQLSLVGNTAALGLFWECLDDILHAQAVYAATGEWETAFAPIAIAKPTEKWIDIRRTIDELQREQSGLNMNKKAVLMQAMTLIGAS